MVKLKIYGIIYKIENLVNGKVYIGQTTKGFDKRYRGHGIEGVYKYHKSKFESNDNYNKHLYNAIEKYGFENFKVYEQFDIAFSKIELDIKEKVYITLYNSTNKEYGYNNKEGGANGKHTEETKRKISQAQLQEKNHMYGKVGKENHASKPIIDLVDDIVYDSANIAAKELGLSASHICSVARGERGSCGGHVFRYLDKNNNIIQPKNIAFIKYKNLIERIPEQYKKYISPIPCQAEQSEGVTTIQK